MSVFTAGVATKLTRVQLRRHVGRKPAMLFVAGGVMSSFIAGSAGGYVASSSAAY